MKKTILGLATTTLALAAIPTAAPAQPWQGIDARQERIHARIRQGERSGELTRFEAARLRDRFGDLVRLERRYRANDGRLDRRERAELNRRYDVLSAQVWRNKHNGPHRG